MNRPWNEVKFTPTNIPTMVSREELRYLYWLGRNYLEGEGEVLEIGPWLGGSTAALLQGMSENSKIKGLRLHAVDNFIWRDFMAQRYPLSIVSGESFESECKNNLSAFASMLVTHQMVIPNDTFPLDAKAQEIRDDAEKSLPVFVWNAGHTIQLVHIDGAKTWTGMTYLLNQIKNCVLPGKSLLVCQDYKYWGAYWVSLLIEFLMDYLEPLHNLPVNTVAFQVKATVRINEAKIPLFADIDVQTGMDLLKRASERLLYWGDVFGASVLQLAMVRFLLNKNYPMDAVTQFRKVERSWRWTQRSKFLEEVRLLLDTETGQRVSPSYRSRLRRKILTSKLKSKRMLMPALRLLIKNEAK